ncbi:MAG: diguanylate cyclase, partial [Candidatus Aureabacteria bacterium]|nr:diguanylate cyclase [Candidatus Auribacterota bacterium]
MRDSKEKVLVVEEPESELRNILLNMDYHLIDAVSIEEIMRHAQNENPALIIGDFIRLGSIGNVCQQVKNHWSSRNVPLIVVSENNRVEDKIAAAENGASDYIVKPFEHVEEVTARIRRSVQNMKHALHANPLTLLPGNLVIHEMLNKMIHMKKSLAVCYFDIDHFKSFNDLYGYAAGDRIISMAASLIRDCCEGVQMKDFFIGHIGGDDFVMISHPEKMEQFCKRYIREFEERVPAFYDKETVKRGFILGRDRKGYVTTYPLVSISIAVVINEGGQKFRHIGEIACHGAEIKKYLKTIPGSSYLID